MFENAGSQNSLVEDREPCAMEIDKSPAAMTYGQNPVDLRSQGHRSICSGH
jgi:hypothetical protein